MSKTAFIIDDDKTTLFLYEHIVKKSGGFERVFVFTSGVEALSQVEKHQTSPDIVFLDLNMPVMDGESFLKRFRQLNKKSVVVLVTSHSDKIANSEELSLANDSVDKPLTFEKLKKLQEKYF